MRKIPEASEVNEEEGRPHHLKVELHSNPDPEQSAPGQPLARLFGRRAVPAAQLEAQGPSDDDDEVRPPFHLPLREAFIAISLPSSPAAESGGEGNGEPPEGTDATAEEEPEPRPLLDGRATYQRLSYLARELRGHQPSFRVAAPPVEEVDPEQPPHAEVTVLYDKPAPESDAGHERHAFPLQRPEEETPVSNEPDERETPLAHPHIESELGKFDPGWKAARDRSAEEVRASRMENTVGGGITTEQLVVRDRIPLQQTEQATEKRALVEVEDVTTGDRTTAIERPYDHNFVNAWEALGQAGLPVPDDIRVCDSGKLLVEDVKADGNKEIYDKALLFVLENDLQRERPHPENDPVFMEVIRHQSGEIYREATDYATLAAMNGIGIAADDPFVLVVDRSGSWEIRQLDLRETALDQEPAAATTRNFMLVDAFFHQLNRIYNLFETRA